MVKERNPILVILFTMITCGIYALYWYYATSKELNEKGALETSAGMMLLYMFIPILNFVAMWKYAKAIEALSKGEKGAGMLFVIALVFAPAFFYMAQSELNKHAAAARSPARRAALRTADCQPILASQGLRSGPFVLLVILLTLPLLSTLLSRAP